MESTRNEISAAINSTTRLTEMQYDPRDCEAHIRNTSGPEHRLIPTEFAHPKCLLCVHIIEEVNEIFEQDDSPCQHHREYCITHLLEAVHTSLIWRLSKL
jgi:hypothetical protein